MPIRTSGPPASFIFRIGREHPLRWPDWTYVGESRFDDPRRRFRVLYAGERRACFLETLAGFRPGLLESRQAGVIPPEWFVTRRIARFSLLDPDWRALDLRAGESIQTLREELRPYLTARGYHDLDMSHALGADQALTQTVASWAYDHGCQGIIYASRLALNLTCVAIFEPTAFKNVETSEIQLDDADLLWAVSTLGLSLPS